MDNLISQKFLRTLTYIMMFVVILLDNYSLRTTLPIYFVNIALIEFYSTRNKDIYLLCLFYIYLGFISGNLIPYLNNIKVISELTKLPNFWNYYSILTYFRIHFEQLSVVLLALCYVTNLKFELKKVLTASFIYLIIILLFNYLFDIETYRSRQVLSFINSIFLVFLFFTRKKNILIVRYELLFLVAFLMSLTTVTGLLIYWNLEQPFTHYVIPLSAIMIYFVITLDEDTLYKVFFSYKYYIFISTVAISFMFIEALNNPKNIIIHFCYLLAFSNIGKRIYKKEQFRDIK